MLATPVRRGTPEAALRSIRPEDGGIDSEKKTVSVDDTSLADALKVSDVLEAADTGHGASATDGADGAASPDPGSGPDDTAGDAGGPTSRPN
jgi:hypothetical protein